MSHLLGIDAGLTNTKAALFDASGREVAVAVRQPPDVRPAPEQVERDLGALWAAVAAAVREVLGTAPVDPEAVDGVGVSAHGHGLYLLDGDGAPVRNGIASTDSRADDLLAEWRTEGRAEAVAEIAGYEPFGADPLCLLAWLKRHEPHEYERIDTVLFCKDYLKYRLTGEVCTDEMEASVFEDVDTGAYSSELFELLGVPEAFDALPPIVPSWETMGEVTAAAAAETGLPEGTPVASGLHDVGATALGSGVHEPGQAMLIVGTWGQSILVHGDPASERGAGHSEDRGSNQSEDRGSGQSEDRGAGQDERRPGGITRRYLDGGYLTYKGNRSAATCLDWFVAECGAGWQAAAKERGVSEYAVYDETVSGTSVGAGGVVFHPYLHGSTDNPDASAGFYGLREAHTKADLLRAVYEGVAITQCERLRELAGERDRLDVRIAGGGSNSPVWTGMFADVLGSAVSVPAGTEQGARGAALCAGIATGRYPDHATAVAETVEVERTHHPDPEAIEQYRSVREAFESLREAMGTAWKQLNARGDTDMR